MAWGARVRTCFVVSISVATAGLLACEGGPVEMGEVVPDDPDWRSGASTDPRAPCVTGMPSSTAYCASPAEEREYEPVHQWTTTKDGCTQLYVASRDPKENVARVRRYRMTGVEPCGFARDEGFGEVHAHLSAISATEDGAVFALGPRVVRRISPGPAVDCTPRDVTLGDHALLAMAPGGRTGYVVWDRTTEPKLAKVLVSGQSCEVVAMPAELPEGRWIGGIVADRAEQLHIVETGTNLSLDKQGWIVSSDGEVLGRYGPSRADHFMQAPSGMTPCGSGTCVTDYPDMLAVFDAEGRSLQVDNLPMRDNRFSPGEIVGSAGGPLLRLGWRNGPRGRAGLGIQIIPTP
ncbi:MAG: hypothetical protein BGO98_41790 [Myxococcales bacterium 68-20]|nr:MAG: hypothetical protein BGO98_41790 [Myxococcales bacterium 68-20]